MPERPGPFPAMAAPCPCVPGTHRAPGGPLPVRAGSRSTYLRHTACASTGSAPPASPSNTTNLVAHGETLTRSWAGSTLSCNGSYPTRPAILQTVYARDLDSVSAAAWPAAAVAPLHHVPRVELPAHGASPFTACPAESSLLVAPGATVVSSGSTLAPPRPALTAPSEPLGRRNARVTRNGVSGACATPCWSGSALLAMSVFAFAAYAWGFPLGRLCVLTVTTLLACSGACGIRRRLPATAEALGALALAIVAADLAVLRRPVAPGLSPEASWALGSIVIGAVGLALGRTGLRSARAIGATGLVVGFPLLLGTQRPGGLSASGLALRQVPFWSAIALVYAAVGWALWDRPGWRPSAVAVLAGAGSAQLFSYLDRGVPGPQPEAGRPIPSPGLAALVMASTCFAPLATASAVPAPHTDSGTPLQLG